MSTSSKVKRSRRTKSKATPYDKPKHKNQDFLNSNTVISDAPFYYHAFYSKIQATIKKKILTKKQFKKAIATISAFFDEASQTTTQFTPCVNLAFYSSLEPSVKSSTPISFFTDLQTIQIHIITNIIGDLSIEEICQIFLEQTSFMKYVKGFYGKSFWSWIKDSKVETVQLDELYDLQQISFLREAAPEVKTLSIDSSVKVDLNLFPNLDYLTIRFKKVNMYNSTPEIQLQRFMSQLRDSGRVLKCLDLEGLAGYSFEQLRINNKVVVETLKITQLYAFSTKNMIDSIINNFKVDALSIKTHYTSTQILILAPRTSKDLEEICNNLMNFKTIHGVMITDELGRDLELILSLEWIYTNYTWLYTNRYIFSGELLKTIIRIKEGLETFFLGLSNPSAVASSAVASSAVASSAVASSALSSFFNSGLFDRNLLNLIVDHVCH